jgi:hypothetical protein
MPKLPSKDAYNQQLDIDIQKFIATVNNCRNLAINPFLPFTGQIWPE